MNVVTLVPPTGVLPRQPRSLAPVADIARAQIVRLAMKQPNPLEALSALSIDELRRARREFRRTLRFMQGARETARSWKTLIDTHGAPHALASFAALQIAAAKLVCREYSHSIRLLSLAISFAEANQPTPAA